MGRIKTTLIKHIGQELVERHPEKFSRDFDKNKKAVDELATFQSNRMRNIVAGYITRLKKQEQ